MLHLSARLTLRQKVTIPAGSLPHTLAVNPSGSRLYVADTFANRILICRI